MAITISGTTVTYPDGSTDSTNVYNAIAASAYGGVGTYINSPYNITNNTTTAGSNLGQSPALSGTWRKMGNGATVVQGYASNTSALYVRIS